MTAIARIQTRGSVRRSRRGSAYVMVLGLGMLLTVIGIAVVTVGRVTVRSMNDSRDWTDAQHLAVSAVEHALARINARSDWRTAFNGQTTQKSLGEGTFTWQVVDEADGDLADDGSEPATIFATGTVNNAQYTLRVPLTALSAPLDIFRTCLAAAGEVKMKGDKKGAPEIRATGGPISSNAKTKNEGADIYADIETDTYEGANPVEGTVTAGAPAKQMPASTVFDMYRLQATAISPGKEIKNAVLTPGVNPWGATNAKGFYYIETDKDLKIERFRLHGTLIVKCTGKAKVEVKDKVLLENYDPHAPVLIVDGELKLKVKSLTSLLDESDIGVNLNPAGAPYEDGTDDDETDTYPNEIRGVVHALKKLKIEETTIIRGTAISEDKVELKGKDLIQIIHDAQFYRDPPAGYGTSAGKVRPGKYNQSVN